MSVKIKFKEEYVGFARQILVPDVVMSNASGSESTKYDVLDDVGQAYVLSAAGSEVKTSIFEGKIVHPSFFRVASFPVVRTEDLKFMPDLEDHAKDQAREAIRKQEDGRLVTLLTSAIDDYSKHEEHVVSPSHVIEVPKANPFDKADVEELIGRIKLHELDPHIILTNPVNVSDFRNMGLGLRIIESVMVPEDVVFLSVPREYLGVLPVLYEVAEEENKMVESFRKGWVLDEVIGMIVLNPRGLGVLKKV